MMLHPFGSETKNKNTNDLTRQGSLRKILPSANNKENLFGKQNEDLNNFYSKFYQEYAILSEYKMICSENVSGIYVVPSHKSALLWFGVVFIRRGFYEGGIFRFSIQLDENFPNSKHPIVTFNLPIFHPAISSVTNELNLLGGFPTWMKREQHIWQVLKYIKWVFLNAPLTISNGVNEEAVKVFQTNENEFRQRCLEGVKKSRQVLYDMPEVEDQHYIVFEEYTPHIHDCARQSMIHYNNNYPVQHFNMGPSWVKEGTFHPLSKEEPSSRCDSTES